MGSDPMTRLDSWGLTPVRGRLKVHAARGVDRPSLERKNHSLPVDDEHSRGARGKGDVNIGISKVPDDRLEN